MSNDIRLPRFIAVTGQEGSGKDTYAKHLADKGYLHVSAGDFIRDTARSQGYNDPLPREVLSRVGDELKAKFGPSPITEASLGQFEERKADFPAGLVISGFRRLGELKAFKKHGAVSLWIAADEATRYRNLGYRPDQPEWDAFTLIGKQEYFGETAGGKEGVNLQAIETLADCTVINDADKDSLLQKGDNALAQYANK